MQNLRGYFWSGLSRIRILAAKYSLFVDLLVLSMYGTGRRMVLGSLFMGFFVLAS